MTDTDTHRRKVDPERFAGWLTLLWITVPIAALTWINHDWLALGGVILANVLFFGAAVVLGAFAGRSQPERAHGGLDDGDRPWDGWM